MADPSHPGEILGEGVWLRLLARDGWEYVTRTRGRLAAAIVALTDDAHIILVEQLRVPVGVAVIELPAGLIGDQDATESAATAAQRELLEETGYRARELRELTRGPTSAGLADEQIVLFLATGLERVGEGGGDASESILVHRVPLADAARWLREQAANEKAIDLKVWGALWFAQQHHVP